MWLAAASHVADFFGVASWLQLQPASVMWLAAALLRGGWRGGAGWSLSACGSIMVMACGQMLQLAGCQLAAGSADNGSKIININVASILMYNVIF